MNSEILFERLNELSENFASIHDENLDGTVWDQWMIDDVVSAKEFELENVLEWNTHDYQDVDDERISCLCDHRPIQILNLVQNRFTDERAVIGSCCIKKFGSRKIKYEMKVKQGAKKGIR